MIAVEHLTKTFGESGASRAALTDVSLSVQRGEIAAVVGSSGAGKSTLAKCMNLLEGPTSGQVLLDGRPVTGLRGPALRAARREIGTVFQASSLFRRKTVAENVALPLRYFGVSSGDRWRRIDELLDRVHLGHLRDAYPAQLSGGQQQRVGIARALALRPSVLLADEATSGLDPQTTASILGLIQELRRDLDLTVIIITHEMDVVREAADTVYQLENGRIVESGRVHQVLSDSRSALARQLLSVRSHQPPERGADAWLVSYGAEPVASDWLFRVSAALGEPLGLLGASIETVDKRPVGRAVLSVPSSLASETVAAALATNGLHGIKSDHETYSAEAVTA